MVSSYGGYTVDSSINGAREYTLAIFSVTNEANSNTDANGNPLEMLIGALNLDITKSGTTTFSGATIERIGGATGVTNLVITGCTSTQLSGVWTSPVASTTLGVDASIAAGQTAYFVVKGTISVLDTRTGVVDFVKVSLNNLGSSASDTNNIRWYDGYDSTVSANLVKYLQLDTTSISGIVVDENL
jgi:hypothetical protein